MAKVIAVLALGLIVMSQLSSCTKTETVTQWDTTYVKVHDTIGQASIRFIPVLPDSFGVYQSVRRTMDGPTLLLFKANPSYYIPVAPDTSAVYYLWNSTSNKYIDQVPLPKLLPNSITSVVLYYDQSELQYILANDSQKVIPPPPGYSYVRFINTIADHSVSTYLSVDADHSGNSIVKAGFGEASEYGLLSAGSHTLLVHAAGDNSGNLIDTVKGINIFQEGGYYTVVAQGSQAAHTAMYTVYSE